MAGKGPALVRGSRAGTGGLGLESTWRPIARFTWSTCRPINRGSTRRNESGGNCATRERTTIGSKTSIKLGGPFGKPPAAGLRTEFVVYVTFLRTFTLETPKAKFGNRYSEIEKQYRKLIFEDEV